MVGKKAVRHILVLIFYPLGYEMEINPQMEELIILTCSGITDQEPRSSLQPLVMDSLAQELIDAIIDHVPPCEARSCSLVARLWRNGANKVTSAISRSRVNARCFVGTRTFHRTRMGFPRTLRMSNSTLSVVGPSPRSLAGCSSAFATSRL